MTVQEVFRYLLSPTGLAAVSGFVWSYLVEFFPRFKALSPRRKRAVMYVTTLAIALIIACLEVAVGYAPADFQKTCWPALVTGWSVAYGASQVAHMRKLSRRR